MTDEELLEEVLSRDIPDEAREPFQSMLDGLPLGVARAIGVDIGASPAENLVSSGKMRVLPEERKSLAKFQQSLGPLPKKPPGRR